MWRATAARVQRGQAHRASLWQAAPEPVRVQAVASLQRPRRDINIVIWGVDGGDIDPGLSTDEMGDQLESDMEALLDKSQAIIDKRLEEARKN